MARTILQIEGFDYLVTADLIKRFITATATVVDATGRFGGKCLLGTGATSDCNWPFGATIPQGDRVILQYAYKWAGTGATFITFVIVDSSGQNQFTINMTPTTGIITAGRFGAAVQATGTTALIANTWYYLEWEIVISDTVGEIHLRIDGVEEFSLTGLDTRAAGNGICSNWVIFGQNSGRSTFVDDVVIAKAAAADTAKTSWLGDCRVSALQPTGAGNYAQFTPSAGSNFQNVDDVSPDDDTTYNESITAGHIDSFELGDLPSAGTVYAVQNQNYARKTDAGSRALAAHYRIGGVDFEGETDPVLPTYGWNFDLQETSPATAVAWTDAEVNGMEAGYENK